MCANVFMYSALKMKFKIVPEYLKHLKAHGEEAVDFRKKRSTYISLVLYSPSGWVVALMDHNFRSDAAETVLEELALCS